MFLERGAGVRSNEEAEADFEQNVFHEEGGQGDGVEVGKFSNHGKTGEVAHGAEDVFFSAIRWYGSWLPNVGVDDSEGG